MPIKALHPTYRRGKIARLPREVREALNRSLEDGRPARKILAWLNQLPDTQTVLDEQFGGRAITEDNLSEWRQGGYADWLLQHQALEVTQRLREEHDNMIEAEVDAEADDQYYAIPFIETLSGWIMNRYALAIRRIEQADDAESWKMLREMCRDVIQLRRTDHRRRRLELEETRFGLAQKECDTNELKAHRRWGLEPENLKWLNEHQNDLEEQITELRFRMYGPTPEEFYDTDDPKLVERTKRWRAEQAAKKAAAEAEAAVATDDPEPDEVEDEEASEEVEPGEIETGEAPPKPKPRQRPQARRSQRSRRPASADLPQSTPSLADPPDQPSTPENPSASTEEIGVNRT